MKPILVSHVKSLNLKMPILKIFRVCIFLKITLIICIFALPVIGLAAKLSAVAEIIFPHFSDLCSSNIICIL